MNLIIWGLSHTLCILRNVFLSANGNSFKRLLVSDVKTNHALKCEVSMCDLDQVGKSHSYKAEKSFMPRPPCLSSGSSQWMLRS